MAADCRFSMADSEWSHDGSYGDVRYTKSPGIDNRPMYDLPPEVNAKVRIPSVGQCSPLEEEGEKQKLNAGTSGPPRADFTSKRQQLPRWLKIYLICISIGFVLQLCLSAYIFLSQRSMRDALSKSNDDIRHQVDELQQEVDLMGQATQGAILRLLTAIPQPSTTGNVTRKSYKQGCLSHDIKRNGTCYAIHQTSKSMVNSEAAVACWELHEGSKLASFPVKDVQTFLGNRLTAGTSLWIDGWRSSSTGVFRLADGTVVQRSWIIPSAGQCLALSVSPATVTWEQRSCYASTNSYICQYQATSV